MNRNSSELNEFAKYFSSGMLEYNKSLGHDFIEEKRDGSRVFDAEGNSYIDCFSSSSVYNLGRRNPDVITGLRDALHETDQGNFPMISIEKGLLAEKLASFVPGKLECTVFSVIRGESIDFACKLARGYTKRKEFVAVSGSWFGQTGFALSLSDREDKDRYGPLIPAITTIPYGDLDAAKNAITRKTAAVFIEPVQAEYLCRYNEAFLRSLRKFCKKKGALLVCDETQSGMGRTGKKFFYEYSGIEPDMLIIGEALGAGIFPIAAAIFTQKLNRFMNAHPMIHLSTFGGSDLGCRVALRALDVYEKTRPWENAALLGDALEAGLETIQKNSNGTIRSIGGKGLLLSLELENEEKARAFCRAAAENGLLCSPGEAAKNSVVLRPPLTINREDVDDILIIVSKAADLVGGR
ncbi:MAG: aspartate aminotransferase family protein [bacterium]|nr:aspartate aminotransferase family protein [bacterium]